MGIDQDDAALDAAAVTLRLGQQAAILLKGNFGDLDELLAEAGIPYADGFLFDLGVSSPQLDVAERGFCYQEDAPLDMRMDPGQQTLTAADVVAVVLTKQTSPGSSASTARNGGPRASQHSS